MNKEVTDAYNDSKNALTRWGTQKNKYIENLKSLADAETNLESMVATVTAELDAKDSVSKTAQTALVKGDSRVRETKKEVNKCKRRKEGIRESIDWLKALHHLEKKKMETEAEEIKYTGGGR